MAPERRNSGINLNNFLEILVFCELHRLG